MDRDELTHRAIKAIRAPFSPDEADTDKAAALEMWKRIASLELSERGLDYNESEFIVSVARALVKADMESAKHRPSAIVAACGLKGRAPSIVEGVVLDYLKATRVFDDITPAAPRPTPDQIFDTIKGAETLRGMSERRIRKGIAQALDMLRKR